MSIMSMYSKLFNNFIIYPNKESSFKLTLLRILFFFKHVLNRYDEVRAESNFYKS